MSSCDNKDISNNVNFAFIIRQMTKLHLMTKVRDIHKEPFGLMDKLKSNIVFTKIIDFTKQDDKNC